MEGRSLLFIEFPYLIKTKGISTQAHAPRTSLHVNSFLLYSIIIIVVLIINLLKGFFV